MCKIIICERSAFSSLNVFTQMLHDMSYISKIEYEVCANLYNPMQIKHIYLQISPDQCFQQYLKRSRKEEEEKIDLNYLQICHTYHERCFLMKDDVLIITDNYIECLCNLYFYNFFFNLLINLIILIRNCRESF